MNHAPSDRRFLQRLRSSGRSGRKASPTRLPRSRKLVVEPLEDRRMLSDTITVTPSTVLNSIAYPFLGVNYCEYWDSLQGDQAVMYGLKNAGVQVIRFPGGIVGDYYVWNQPATWNGSGGATTSPLQMSAFAKSVGAQVMMQTNPTTNTENGVVNNPSGANQAAWVQYQDSNNDYVPFWEIGNEEDMHPNMNSAYDWATYQWYIDAFTKQAAAMKAADPTIQVMGNVGTNTWYWAALQSLDMFLSKEGNRSGTGLTDAVSLHWYGGGDSSASWSSVESFAQGWNPSSGFSNWGYIQNAIATNDTRNLPVFVTECNASDGATGSGAVMSTELASALANGDMMGALRNSGVQSVEWFGDIHGVYSPTYGGWGIFYGNGENPPQGSVPQDTPSPKYYMLPIWAACGNEVLGLSSSVSDTSTTLSAYASRSTNGDIQVTIINKTNAARTESVNVSGIAGRAVKIYQLQGATGNIADTSVVYNGVTNPVATTSAPLPAPLSGGTASGSTYTYSVPAYSMTMIDFVANNANLAPVARISAPANTGTIENNAPITVSATAFASGTGNTLSKVEFYQGTTLIGTATSTTGPALNNWQVSWTGAAAGIYSITAKAYSSNGTTTTSAPVSVTVVHRGGTPISVPGTIQAEAYDTGGQNIAFRDMSGSTPQTETTSDTGGGQDVTNIQNMEYLKYSINVATSGTYYLAARVANAAAGGTFHVNIDGVNVTGTMTVPNTGGNQSWYTVARNNISLTAGVHTMQFVVDSNNPATGGVLGNINWFQIGTGTYTEPAPAAPALSGAAGNQLAVLSWNASAGATAYNIYRGTSPTALSLYQGGYTSTTFTDNGLTNGTPYYYQVSALSESGVEGTRSSIVAVTPTLGGPLSAPWHAQDVGSPALAGSSTYGSGVYTIAGAGGDVQGTADQCQFAYEQVSGDVTVTARIISQSNTNEWAKAGVMIRQSLDPGAVNAFTRMTPSHNGGFQFRVTASGTSTDNVVTNSAATPYWLKLVRAGSTFSGYISPDGVTWTLIPGATQTLTMTGTIYVGLAVCSHNTTALSTATFDNVSVALAATPSPSAVTLAAGSGTTTSPTSALTNRNNSSAGKTAQFVVAGTISGALVTVYANGVAIGSATAAGTTTTVTSDGATTVPDGSNSVTARQTVPGSAQSPDSSVLTLVVDTVPPTLTQSINTPAFSGWYNKSTGPAVVTYAASDPGGSGVTTPQAYTFSDGANLSLAGISVTDAAGNVSAPTAGYSGIKQDTVAPTVTQSISSPAANGWYNIASGAAVVHYVTFDATSGVNTPGDVTVADGGNQSVVVTIVTDAAGNLSAATAGYLHLKQDMVAPLLSASISSPAANGWYNIASGPAVVTYAATDATSGVTAPAAHTFSDGAGQSLAAITVSDVAGNVSNAAGAFSGINQDTIPLAVTTLARTASGFDATFNAAANMGQVHLYDGLLGGGTNLNFGEASAFDSDLLLSGDVVGAVQGSLVWDNVTNTAHFVKTGGVLAPDTYHVTLYSRSAPSTDPGWADMAGNLLNGGIYTATFTVAASSDRVFSVPGFARGPGQPVNVDAHGTALGTGLPVSISDGSSVTSFAFDFYYNPALLNVTGATLPAGMPADWGAPSFTIHSIDATHSYVHVSDSGSTPLATGLQTVVLLSAIVPSSGSIYGTSELLSFANPVVNGVAISAQSDEAVHTVVNFGDVNGDGGVNAGDATLASRIGGHLDSGFYAAPLTDPAIIGDVSGDGRVNAQDATYISRFGAHLSVPQIPAPVLSPNQLAMTPVFGGIVVVAAPPAAGVQNLIGGSVNTSTLVSDRVEVRPARKDQLATLCAAAVDHLTAGRQDTAESVVAVTPTTSAPITGRPTPVRGPQPAARNDTALKKATDEILGGALRVASKKAPPQSGDFNSVASVVSLDRSVVDGLLNASVRQPLDLRDT